MKIKFFLGVMAFCISVNIWSMVELGFGGGINLSRFNSPDIRPAYAGTDSAGITFGLDVYLFSRADEEPSSQRFFFRTGMYFLRQHNRYEVQPSDGYSITMKRSLSNFRFPVLFEYALFSSAKFREKIYAGGYMGVHLAAGALQYRVLDLETNQSIKVPEDHEIFSNIETSKDGMELGFSGGLRTELKLESGTIVFDIGYSQSLDGIKNPKLLFNRQGNKCLMMIIGYKFN